MSDHRPIGVFDSGLGGLRVLDRLMQAFPSERFVYLGDTLNMPYGHKSHDDVKRFVAAALAWFFEPGENRLPVKMMVIACNTAAAVASGMFARYAAPPFSAPFVDPVTAICRWLADADCYKHIGVMATPATVASNRYRRVLDSLDATALKVRQVGCEHLATVIEEGGLGTPACDALLVKYLAPLQAARVEAIVLGCTHYPYAQDRIAALAPETDILDPDIYMVREVGRLLRARQLAAPPQTDRALAAVEYFVTADSARFYEVSHRMPFRALAMKTPSVITLSTTPVEPVVSGNG
jgi:glutamate racemase